MYEVWVYDTDQGKFTPVKIKDRTLRFMLWVDAANAKDVLMRQFPDRYYDVQYRRRKK